MDEKKWLAEQFVAHRAHLRAVAYRMLGSHADVDDAVQEAWLRLNRSDMSAVENLGGWLTTIVARVCLDMLRSRKSRREEAMGPDVPEPIAGEESSPEHERLMADSVGLALLVVLDKLTPAERVALVLHDMFDLPFEEIAPIIGRTATATRQLASRARRRAQGAAAGPDSDFGRQRELVAAFLAASRAGDFEALLAVLDPDVAFHSDSAAVQMGGPAEVRGAAAVAATFKGRAKAAQLAAVNGAVGLVVIIQGQLRIVLDFMIADGKVTKIEAIADPERLRQTDLVGIGGRRQANGRPLQIKTTRGTQGNGPVDHALLISGPRLNSAPSAVKPLAALRGRLLWCSDSVQARPRTQFSPATGLSCASISTSPASKNSGVRCVGRSRGGLTTKIHARVDAKDRSVRLLISPGKDHDITCARALLDGHEPRATFFAFS